MKTIKLKFKAGGVSQHENGSMTVVAHTPVCEENKVLSETFPSANIAIHIEAGNEAQKLFKEGKSYIIDINPAD